MSNSFITNVNTLVDNLSTVYTANEKLTPEVINQLTALNLAQLQAVYVELAKIVDVQANMSSVVTTAGAIESIVTLANYLDAASAPSIVEDLILINSKLDALTASVDFLTETITGLGSAQLAIESQSSPVFADIPTVPTIMPFNVETPSSNTDIISTDALQDTITFKLNGSYTFTSNVSVTSKTNTTVALSFKIVDIATGNVLATESNTVHISKHSTATLPLTTLLTISNAPVTVRVEAQSTASGYELTAFNSLLVSSVTVGLPDIYAERLYVVEKDSSTGAANLPSGNTAERPDTAELGAIRYNTDINEYEGYTDSGWESLAAGATGSNGDNVFLITDKVMTTDYTVPENKRAVAFGDVELIGDLTIPNNSELLVLGDYKDGMVVVNDISKLSTVNTSVSTNVAVKSYHNGLEGGGGVFYYDSTKPRTAHNGGTVIAPNAVFPSDWNNQVQLAAWFDGSSLTENGCWVRSYDGAVNVKWFGAKGDEVADDTVAIQKAINSFYDIYIPQGNFIVSATLSKEVNNLGGFKITGAGVHSKLIWNSPTASNGVLRIYGVSGSGFYQKSIFRDFEINGNDVADGLVLGNSAATLSGGLCNVTIDNVRVFNSKIGINIYSESDEVTISNCHIRVFTTRGISNTGGSGVRIINNHIQDPITPNTTCIYSGLTAITITGNVLQTSSSTMNGILIENARGFTISNNYSEVAYGFTSEYFVRVVNSISGYIGENEIGGYVSAKLIDIDSTSKAINIGTNTHIQSGGLISSLVTVANGAENINIYGKQHTNGVVHTISGYDNCTFISDYDNKTLFSKGILTKDTPINSISTYYNLPAFGSQVIATLPLSKGASYLFYLNALIYNTEITAFVNISYAGNITITQVSKTGTDLNLTSSGQDVVISTPTNGVKSTLVCALKLL